MFGDQGGTTRPGVIETPGTTRPGAISVGSVHLPPHMIRIGWARLHLSIISFGFVVNVGLLFRESSGAILANVSPSACVQRVCDQST